MFLTTYSYDLKRVVDRITRNTEVINRLFFDNLIASSLILFAYPFHSKV